ncbi:hypothetical protein BEN47_09865 [Hymenobacter lapidarius]|uniref:Uncharacterized protein n=1 Tax=Hymenobacter lapidarius TaxID=1908237 RepID=A0A1G1TAZ5_9BACT|nr:hypothetical protein BEN47_09865 [Hymenobacter lapidarius]
MVPYESIVSYDYNDFRGNANLGFKLQDGNRFGLSINSYFQDTRNFTEMVAAFKGSFYHHQHNQVRKGGTAV